MLLETVVITRKTISQPVDTRIYKNDDINAVETESFRGKSETVEFMYIKKRAGTKILLDLLVATIGPYDLPKNCDQKRYGKTGESLKWLSQFLQARA